MTRFSLWQERWIPVVRDSGQPDLVSIRDGLVTARAIREVYDPSPLVTVAVHRLLLAILYRVFHPQNVASWANLWRTGRLDPTVIDAYGAKWAERFDLLNPDHPFYQVPIIQDEKTHPISALVLEAASGNNPTLFDHGSVESVDWLPPDRAACHLLAHQQFAVGGGISKPFNRMDGPLTKGLVVEAKGRDLFETLLLNLLPLDYWRDVIPGSDDDAPFWELKQVPNPVSTGTRPLGPMHYLTWQSRQIHLAEGPEAGQITGCQIRQRFCLPKDGARIDPNKAYRRSKQEGWLPFKVAKQRSAWQFTHVLLQQATSDLEPPGVVKWLAVAEKLRELPLPPVIGLSVSGLTNDPKKAAKIELWRREHLPVPAAFLDNPSLVGDLADLMGQARRVEGVLQRTGQVLVWALAERNRLADALAYFWTGKLAGGGKVPSGLLTLAESLGLVTRYWPALEHAFRTALEELPDRDFAEAQDHWREALRRAASQAFRAERDALLHTGASFEVLSQIEHAFQTRLANAFVEKPKEGSADDDEGADE